MNSTTNKEIIDVAVVTNSPKLIKEIDKITESSSLLESVAGDATSNLSGAARPSLMNPNGNDAIQTNTVSPSPSLTVVAVIPSSPMQQLSDGTDEIIEAASNMPIPWLWVLEYGVIAFLGVCSAAGVKRHVSTTAESYGFWQAVIGTLLLLLSFSQCNAKVFRCSNNACLNVVVGAGA